MVNISKGNKEMSVPAGSLKKFLNAGWRLAEKSDAKSKRYSKAEEKPVENTGYQPDEYEECDDEEYEEVDPEELAAKPLNELDTDELRILAEYKGIDVSELKTAKKLRAALEALE